MDMGDTKGWEQSGRRPILVVSHEVFNQKSGTVIGVAITSKEPRAGFPLTLKFIGTKLPKSSWAKIGQIRTISSERLEKKVGRVSADEIESVIEGLLEIVG